MKNAEKTLEPVGCCIMSAFQIDLVYRTKFSKNWQVIWLKAEVTRRNVTATDEERSVAALARVNINPHISIRKRLTYHIFLEDSQRTKTALKFICSRTGL